MKDETSIGMTNLTNIQIDTCNSEPFSQKPNPTTMKHCNLVKHEINKLSDAQVICSSHSSWSAPIIVVHTCNGWKCLVINYTALNKVTLKFVWPMPKVEDIFSKLNGVWYFSTLDLQAGYYHIPLDDASIPKTAFTHEQSLEGLPFATAYLDDIIIYSKTKNTWTIYNEFSTKVVHGIEQMPFLCQRNPIFGSYPQCSRYKTPTIENWSY